MEVRHNTELLEKALEHVVRRASIPILAAQAAAQAQQFRASAFRRLATGGAVAIAALGIGIAGYLSSQPGIPWARLPDRIASFKPAEPPRTDEAAPVAMPRPSWPGPAEPRAEKPPVVILQPSLPKAPEKPTIETVDFSIFRSRGIDRFGRTWQIEAGHHFETELDQTSRKWKSAWCYTVPEVDGVPIRVRLADRPTVASAPSLADLNANTLSKVSLTSFEMQLLATECPWLDGKEFTIADLRGGTIELPQPRLDGRTLVFDGPIGQGFTSQLRKYDFDRLQIDSPGGFIDEAMAAGRWLRGANKDVSVSQTCLSACVFVLAGGRSRTASEAAHIGVHRFRKMIDEGGDIERGQAKSAEIVRYLHEMGVSTDLWLAMAETPSETMLYLDHAKLRAWNLLAVPEKMVQIAGHDFIGNDLEGMPLRQIPLDGCERQCLATTGCKAATYNSSASACFLKTDIGTVIEEPSAISLYRREIRERFRRPQLTLLPRIELFGPPLQQPIAMRYPDCVVSCDSRRACAGFSYFGGTQQCRLLRSITGESANPIATSARR